MSGILDLLNSELGNKIVGGISRETHQPEDKTAAVVAMAMPILMGAMKRNTHQKEAQKAFLMHLTKSTMAECWITLTGCLVAV